MPCPATVLPHLDFDTTLGADATSNGFSGSARAPEPVPTAPFLEAATSQRARRRKAWSLSDGDSGTSNSTHGAASNAPVSRPPGSDGETSAFMAAHPPIDLL